MAILDDLGHVCEWDDGRIQRQSLRQAIRGEGEGRHDGGGWGCWGG